MNLDNYRRLEDYEKIDFGDMELCNCGGCDPSVISAAKVGLYAREAFTFYGVHIYRQEKDRQTQLIEAF